MYTALSGAKGRSMKLKKLLQEIGIDIRLHECQAMVARAGGFRDWHEMLEVLSQGDHRMDPQKIRARLLAEVPAKGRPVVGAWLDRSTPRVDEDSDWQGRK